MKHVEITFVLVSLILLSACSSSDSPGGMSDAELNVHLQYACAEFYAYNDSVDDGDMETADSHWARVLDIQNNLNLSRPHSQIDPNDWGLICQ